MESKKEPVRYLMSQGILTPEVIWRLESEFLREQLEIRGGTKVSDIGDDLEVYRVPRKKKGNKEAGSGSDS